MQDAPTSKAELWRLTARQAIDLLKRREIRPLDLVEASLARIAATDGAIHAMPTLCAERARAEAASADAGSLLAGLPIAVKDLEDVAGVRTTYGSPIYAAHVPARSDLMVERLEAAGAVVIGKSNTPEFGAGAIPITSSSNRPARPGAPISRRAAPPAARRRPWRRARSGSP